MRRPNGVTKCVTVFVQPTSFLRLVALKSMLFSTFSILRISASHSLSLSLSRTSDSTSSSLLSFLVIIMDRETKVIPHTYNTHSNMWAYLFIYRIPILLIETTIPWTTYLCHPIFLFRLFPIAMFWFHSNIFFNICSSWKMHAFFHASFDEFWVRDSHTINGLWNHEKKFFQSLYGKEI